MKIKALENTVASGESILRGKTYDVSKSDGRTLVNMKKAVAVETPVEKMSINDAIESLDAESPDHFTEEGKGKPRVEVLEELMGRNVTGQERDLAWSEYEVKQD